MYENRLLTLATLGLALGVGLPGRAIDESGPGERSSTLRRGYEARACGFDLDGDGIHGESQDDCNVCDGTTGLGPLTRDVDGDGVREDEIYVDGSAGRDLGGCGGPANPCRSIAHAVRFVANGPTTGGEDILCFGGVGTEWAIVLPHGGRRGTHLRARSENEVRDWLFASDPLMIVGWDRDDDGAYPPFDRDDVAVLDGSDAPSKSDGALFDLNDNDFVEIAHLTIRNYLVGSTDLEDIHLAEESNSDYVSWHDLEIEAVLKDNCASGGRILWEVGGGTPRFWSWENIELRAVGGAWWRGFASYEEESGPLRWTRITASCDSASEYACHGSSWEASCNGWDLTGRISGLEILDSIWDANPLKGGSRPGSGAAILIQAATCTSDWDVVNNEIVNWQEVSQRSGGKKRYCNPGSPTEDFRLERNILRSEVDIWKEMTGVKIVSGDGLYSNRVRDVSVVGNTWFCPVPQKCHGFVSGRYGNSEGREADGALVIAGNTIYVPNGARRGPGVLLDFRNALHERFTNQVDRIVLENNIVAGDPLIGSTSVFLPYVPAEFVSRNNVWTGRKWDWYWEGRQKDTIVEWKQASGESDGRSCRPAFVDPEAGDLHLRSDDTCAVGAAAPSEYYDRDIDGEPRPSKGPWSAGADETPGREE